MNTDESNAQLIQLEKNYWQAIKDRDVATCVQLSADPCLVAGPQGVGSFTRAQMKAMMEQGGQYTLVDYELKDFQTQLLTPDVGVVAYTVHQSLTVEGKTVAFTAAENSTWVKKDGAWACALHSEAILGDPFGRDKAKP